VRHFQLQPLLFIGSSFLTLSERRGWKLRLLNPHRTLLSSRSERTRISYFAALNNDHVCDSQQREAHAAYRLRSSRQEIRGSERRDLRFASALATFRNHHSLTLCHPGRSVAKWRDLLFYRSVSAAAFALFIGNS
jgi:hypothetical protein